MTALRSLERFAKSRRLSDAARCDLCADLVAEHHRHAVDVIERRLVCVCGACSILLAGNERGRYRAVPERVRIDPTWRLEDEDLNALGVPVTLAFFFRCSWSGNWTAILPSPAGATEAEIDEEAWTAFAAKAWLPQTVADDVEAVLVYQSRTRVLGKRRAWTALVVPIDIAYEVAGLVRRHWRGIDGGDEARQVLDERIATLVAAADVVSRGDLS